MAVQSVGSVVEHIVVEALKTSNVAGQAGVSPTTWALSAAAGGHVFLESDGPDGIRSAGRAPYIEVAVLESALDQNVEVGGEARTRVRVTAVVNRHATTGTPTETARDLLEAAIAAIRSLPANRWGLFGDETYLEPEGRGCLVRVGCEVTLIHSYDRPTDAGTAITVP